MARLHLSHEQSCQYCRKPFVPVKRGTQRFCSATCRVTYCRKGKAGTLGRVQTGKKPVGAAPTFGENVLASGLGALGANAVSQSAEYLLVTKRLEKRIETLEKQLSGVLQNQQALLNKTVAGFAATLRMMRVPEDKIAAVLQLERGSSTLLPTAPPVRRQFRQAPSSNPPSTTESSDAW